MSEIDMKIDPARASALVSQLQGVSERVAAVAKGRAVSFLVFFWFFFLVFYLLFSHDPSSIISE